MMSEAVSRFAQPVEIPSRIPCLTEKKTTHIVVDAVDFMAQVFKVFDRFGTNQPAGPVTRIVCVFMGLNRPPLGSVRQTIDYPSLRFICRAAS